jgi:hypothetical protein
VSRKGRISAPFFRATVVVNLSKRFVSSQGYNLQNNNIQLGATKPQGMSALTNQPLHLTEESYEKL